MKLAKLMRRLGWLCFLLVWIPFAFVMFKGPLSIAMSSPEAVVENMQDDFFGRMGIWIGLIVAFGVLSGALIFGSVIVSAVSNRRVIAKGRDAEAKILAVKDTNTRINGDPVISCSLEVRPPDGPRFLAETSLTISPLYLADLRVGRIVTVRYLPGTDRVAITGTKRENGN